MTTIETLEDWNNRLEACGCCPMPNCPSPSIQIQYVNRSLCAMTASPAESHIGSPAPKFLPANGGVPSKEASVAYRTMRVTNSFSTSDDFGSNSDHYNVTQSKDPETAEDNRVGIPAYICAKTRVNGSWSSAYTFKNANANVVQSGTNTGSWSNEVASPFGATPGTGTSSWTTYDDNGAITGSGGGESQRTYGPAWFAFANPTTVTTTVQQAGLRHEVAGGGRNLTVQFEDPHTDASAFAAISTPTPESDDWASLVGLHAIASFAIGRADEENDDMRVTGAVHRIGRYRWRIPHAHPGATFKIWWDEGLFSKEWLEWEARVDAYEAWQREHEEWEQSQDNPKPPEPQEPPEPGDEPTKPTLTAKSFVWTGPGNANDPSHNSWFSPYSAVVRIPSANEGQVEICNVRFLCYESKFGGKPQVDHGYRLYNPDE